MGERTGKRAVRRGHAGIASGVLMIALMATAPAALAKKHAAAAKPDLAVASAHVVTTGAKDGMYVFQGERDPNISIGDRTVNVGKGKAGWSVTKVFLEHGGQRWLLAQREVPPLAPKRGDSDTDLVVHLMDFPIGAYTLEFCADANHRYHEGTRKAQCGKVGTLDFWVAAKRWTGSIAGEYDAILGNVERWSAPNAQLVFSRYEGSGIFGYDFVGTVTWTDSGTDEDGCTWSGSGSRGFGPQNPAGGAMGIDYKHEEYNGAFFQGAPFFQTNISCPNGGSSGVAAPEAIGFFASHPGAPTPLPFGSTTLPGSPTTGPLGTSFSWNLRPAGP